eukprot:TRINITY_DN7672_c0_g2_i1.p1 TRINITY_DN7672_c0_g2~~TRINITY_DN7672_c0_g2_i1.p1  ORF type:complete len:430 (-),score=52.90 TRINITY_DN7672_c0_g2_i1:21-1310(-)
MDKLPEGYTPRFTIVPDCQKIFIFANFTTPQRMKSEVKRKVTSTQQWWPFGSQFMTVYLPNDESRIDSFHRGQRKMSFNKGDREEIERITKQNVPISSFGTENNGLSRFIIEREQALLINSAHGYYTIYVGEVALHGGELFLVPAGDIYLSNMYRNNFTVISFSITPIPLNKKFTVCSDANGSTTYHIFKFSISSDRNISVEYDNNNQSTSHWFLSLYNENGTIRKDQYLQNNVDNLLKKGTYYLIINCQFETSVTFQSLSDPSMIDYYNWFLYLSDASDFGYYDQFVRDREFTLLISLVGILATIIFQYYWNHKLGRKNISLAVDDSSTPKTEIRTESREQELIKQEGPRQKQQEETRQQEQEDQLVLQKQENTEKEINLREQEERPKKREMEIRVQDESKNFNQEKKQQKPKEETKKQEPKNDTTEK